MKINFLSPIVKKIFPKKTAPPKNVPLTVTSQDIKAIAGEDVLATQLDLARAYLEIGKESLAKKILKHVADHGDLSQQRNAQELLKKL